MHTDEVASLYFSGAVGRCASWWSSRWLLLQLRLEHVSLNPELSLVITALVSIINTGTWLLLWNWRNIAQFLRNNCSLKLTELFLGNFCSHLIFNYDDTYWAVGRLISIPTIIYISQVHVNAFLTNCHLYQVPSSPSYFSILSLADSNVR